MKRFSLYQETLSNCDTRFENLVAAITHAFQCRMHHVIRHDTVALDRRAVGTGDARAGESHREAARNAERVHISVGATALLSDDGAESIVMEDLKNRLVRAHRSAVTQHDHRH